MLNSNTAIGIKNLTMAYGDFIIQRGLNFEINKGEIFIIMGDSGSGKSSQIVYKAGDFWAGSEEDRKIASQRFGVLYQSGALWSSMTLAQNIRLPLVTYTNYSESDIRDIIDLKLSLVGLAGFEDFYPSEISGGMKKRAGLARAMALDPEILFFDEPGAGLDPISSARLDDLIIELRDGLGATIVIVTHELDSIFAIGDPSLFLVLCYSQLGQYYYLAAEICLKRNDISMLILNKM